MHADNDSDTQTTAEADETADDAMRGRRYSNPTNVRSRVLAVTANDAENGTGSDVSIASRHLPEDANNRPGADSTTSENGILHPGACFAFGKTFYLAFAEHS